MFYMVVALRFIAYTFGYEKGLNLDTWPLIPILLNGSNDGKYFVSYKYGKLRSLLMKTDKAICKNEQKSIINHDLCHISIS